MVSGEKGKREDKRCLGSQRGRSARCWAWELEKAVSNVVRSNRIIAGVGRSGKLLYCD